MTSTDEAIRRFFADDGPLARRIPGYRARAAQIDMALAVDEALAEPGARLVVEAGTGTGKSFAYLVPALLRGMKIAVATGTKALQEQLYEKDVPLVVEALADELGLVKTAALMKGRQNYLCRVRFERFQSEPLFAFADDARHFEALVDWAGKTVTGDRKELHTLPDDWRTWSDIDAGAETCLGSKCPAFEECAITRMRRAADAADLVIVNHHLLCADVRVRLEGMPAKSEAPGEDDRGLAHARVIPDVDAVVIDEAHALPDVATSYFGVSFAKSRVDRLLGDVKRTSETLEKTAMADIGRALALVEPEVKRVFDAATPRGGREPRERARLARESDDTAALVKAAKGAVTHLENVAQRLESQLSGGVDPVADIELSGLVRRATQCASELAFIVDKALPDPAFVTAVEREGRALVAQPIDVATALARTLFDGARPVILTSATLAVDGSARAFAGRVGLSLDDEAVRAQVLPSPFDFEEHAALYAPKDFPEPDDERARAAFDDEVRFLVELAQGGALLLFTSHKALDGAFARLAAPFVARGHVVMRQGEAPKAALLARMREETGPKGAVLFATQSFWEGVDLPGRALRLVVIDRLPFRSPGDPLVEARNELVTARGGNAFHDVSVPEAALALKQGVGRLIRTEADAGVVAVLDGRIRTKRYGKVFLTSLPPLLRVGSREGLARFWSVKVAPRLFGTPRQGHSGAQRS